MQFSIERTWGIALVVLVAGVLSGCSALGLGGNSCGPGDNEIGSIGGTAQSVSVTGEVTETGPAMFVVDDGSGKAAVMAQSDVSEGDCVTVSGSATDAGTGQTEADVAIAASDVSTN